MEHLFAHFTLPATLFKSSPIWRLRRSMPYAGKETAGCQILADKLATCICIFVNMLAEK